MPELPEVETIRRGLDPVLCGRRIADVVTSGAGLRLPFPPGLQEKLSGQKIAATERRAKYILIRLEDGKILILHLGMSGRVRILPPQEADRPRQKHDHFSLTLDNGTCIVLNDPRRFGSVLLFESESERTGHPAFRTLGPEPLAENFSGAIFQERLSGRKTAIKQAIMDQGIVAGVGNIYASEALFRAGISPFRPAGSLDASEAQNLAGGIRAVLEDAIAAGGSSLKDYRKADGSMGYFQHGFSVYDRAGQKCPQCRCDPDETGGIEKTVQGGRATYYCERIQK